MYIEIARPNSRVAMFAFKDVVVYEDADGTVHAYNALDRNEYLGVVLHVWNG